MKLIAVLSLLLSTLFLACQSNNERIPTSHDPLTKVLKAIQVESEQGVESYKECIEKTTKHYQTFFNLNHEETLLENYSIAQLESLLDSSFKSRLNILKVLKGLNGQTTEAYKCFSSVRDLTRALRYFEDYVVEKLEVTNQKTNKEYTTLEGEGSILLVNPKYTFTGHKDLKSGDVILSRGNAYTSAAIARIGTIDAQFSHVTSVYRDEKGVLHTTEAHIEIGSVAMPWKVHVDQGNAREVVFRYKDIKIAHEAAKFVFERVKKFSRTHKHNINYDFTMDYKNNSDLFCSEVVSSGFSKITENKVDIPRYKTKFDARLIPFLKNIGIGVTRSNINQFKTFGPGDLEFDDRFDLVAEWRKPTKLKGIRMKDAVLSKMYEWMASKRYKLRQGIKIPLSARLAWLTRRIPLVKKSLVEKFPLNMKPKLLGTFLILDEVGDILLAELEKRQAEVSYPLSFKEMYRVLEDFREKDSKLKRRKSKLHKKFRP